MKNENYQPRERLRELRVRANLYGGLAITVGGSIAAMRYYLFPGYDGSAVNEGVKWAASAGLGVATLPITIPLGVSLGAISLAQLRNKKSLERKVD